jgi:hypothetical protein
MTSVLEINRVIELANEMADISRVFYAKAVLLSEEGLEKARQNSKSADIALQNARDDYDNHPTDLARKTKLEGALIDSQNAADELRMQEMNHQKTKEKVKKDNEDRSRGDVHDVGSWAGGEGRTTAGGDNGGDGAADGPDTRNVA